ncbi:helix-turn-helix domain-containing protein [Nostoc sp. LEGE 12447]|uniref:helix-turn-helix domain-containing protein n=1 Tax=Nostoc sp. LEGE 12447 TaxID=1828640 RepID=UPI0018833B00|nr:helix-turn-helix domain-containing protein [Nostoc sp. LEGE 12447]MBE9001409.1 helix-turn-helix domain-containing protein [Nostoc sp. LEGE 12447]
MGFRNGKPSKQFTAIPNSLIRDHNVTDSTFRLISWVASHDENFDINFTVIEKHLGYKRDKIRNAIKNAEQNDYLVRVQENNPNNGKFDWQYYIFTSKEDTKLFRENHSSIGESSVSESSVSGSSVSGSSIGGSSIGGSSIGGSSTPHIEKQLEENKLEEKHIQETPPTQNALPAQESCVCETEQLNLEKPTPEKPSLEESTPEEPTPQQPASLSKNSESLQQTDNPSKGSTIAAGSFDKNEQSNNPKKPKFQSIEDLVDMVLVDPSIMATDSLPAVYRTEIKIRGWRFPWRTATRDKIYQTCDRRLVELIAKQRAKWSERESWQEKIPTVIKSISNLEGSKAGLEELLGYWSQVVKPSAIPEPTTQQKPDETQPIGYYSNRSLDWHKATFSELLDRMDEVGKDKVIASFSSRYDQQDPGATLKWLDWLKLTHPQMYMYLHPQAA